ncbi:MAG: NAD(P)-dependent oxidoreductase [Alphaproteobacteria bacterium]|nr:NAD(P)-dependent oxidoreductase [Alphaproteobacteria bacterium]
MNKQRIPGVATGRLTAEEYSANFSDIHPPLSAHEALVEAQRCYFCHDAPCMTACPTSIDVPLFIRQIATRNAKGAAHTIFKQNIVGGMCARVCPTETLCEEACVRNEAEEKPVRIGQLQRYATDVLMESGEQKFSRAAATGKKVAVVGAGPAGLACAHRLSMHGHDVTIFEAKEKAGGLNEYGLAAYKTPGDFAQREIDYILGIGGIEVRSGVALGKNLSLDDLTKNHDAVFLGLGMGGVNALGIEGEDLNGVADAIDYIADLRQTADKAKLPVGRRVVVIGGGMTAVDIAVQTKRLGAEEVSMVYRRGREQLKASSYEQELAQTSGVQIRLWAAPVRIVGEGGKVTGVEFEYQGDGGGTGETFTLAADQVFKAIGQKFLPADIGDSGITLKGGRIGVDEERRTSVAKIWAGGDCVDGGEDLTVASVEDGKLAAESIHRTLTA